MAYMYGSWTPPADTLWWVNNHNCNFRSTPSSNAVDDAINSSNVVDDVINSKIVKVVDAINDLRIRLTTASDISVSPGWIVSKPVLDKMELNEWQQKVEGEQFVLEVESMIKPNPSEGIFTIEMDNWKTLFPHPFFNRAFFEAVVAPQQQSLNFFHTAPELQRAFTAPYKKDGIRQNIVRRLLELEEDSFSTGSDLLYYSRCLDLVASSGSGKSRAQQEMARGLHQPGENVDVSIGSNSSTFSRFDEPVYCIPICLREPGGKGWPPSDSKVYTFFNEAPTEYVNSLSYAAHWRCAAFLATTLTVGLERLKLLASEHGRYYNVTVRKWADMIGYTDRSAFMNEYREEFWTTVLERTRTLMQSSPAPKTPIQTHASPKSPPLKKRSRSDSHSIGATAAPQVTGTNPNPVPLPQQYWTNHIANPARELHDYLRGLDRHEDGVIVEVICFDEVTNLGEYYWVMQRILSCQPADDTQKPSALWMLTMATNSSLSEYRPPTTDINSSRLQKEARIRLAPYFEFGFDHYADEASGDTTMGHLRSWMQASHFGRPMWHAYMGENDGHDLLSQGIMKLLCGHDEDWYLNRDIVLALFSSIIAVDIIRNTADAAKLASDAVAKHMRVFDGLQELPLGYKTHAPSEPVLALCANALLFAEKGKHFRRAFGTFVEALCRGNLIPRGDLGELGARLILLAARMEAVPEEAPPDPTSVPANKHRNPTYVSLPDFLKQLLGEAGIETGFVDAFQGCYVNFTHFIVTEQALPENFDIKYLANLWARGAALQCSHNQEVVDIIIVVYHGSVEDDAAFDPSLLSCLYAQIKLKAAPDYVAAKALRPVGLSDHIAEMRLPYVVMLMELGTKAKPNANKQSGLVAVHPPSRHMHELPTLQAAYVKAASNGTSDRARAELLRARAAREEVGRWCLVVRSQEYAIVKKLGIYGLIASLLGLDDTQEESDLMKTTRPCLRWNGKYVDWMVDYTCEGHKMIGITSEENAMSSTANEKEDVNGDVSMS
ncbi:hypothetical protein CALVIDRAFT_542328 [Calocera viscosa TUFC12733]|uniref:Uncharacterized protein n=1 Tax=Calocera viscosa (strain TUFC12733) TaxID=1330018 RepID=A0A167GSX8_CALVF|nr:hypothetical protein CALVIDRAFT_542328 [Calocera viscosa TUFC12733]